MQVDEQPSPSFEFPSSQASFPPIALSPQATVKTQGLPGSAHS
jgi:hypothetical protein